MPLGLERVTLLPHLRRIALAAIAATAAGCASAPPPDPADDQQFDDAVQLSAQLLVIADIASSVFSERVVQLRIDGASDLIVYTAEAIRNNSVANYRAIALSPDPANGLVNMYIYANLGSWACETRVATHPELFEEDCDRTYGEVLREVRQLAHEWMSPEQIADLDRRIDEFRSRHPDRMIIGMVRLEDLARQFAMSEQRKDQVTPSLFSPVTEAAQQLEQVRLLGDRAIWLLSRLPETISWRASAFLMEVLSSDGFVAIKELAGGISERLDLVRRNVDTLDQSMQKLGDGLEQSTASIGSLETGIAGLEDSLATTAKGLGSMSESIASIPERFASLASVLAETSQSLEGNVAGLREVAASGQALESKLASLDEKIVGLESSVASLTVEIQTLEGAKSIIDETLLKAAGLGALLIVFAGVSRYAVHHLTKAK
jgi:phage shock protein A